ncbi:MAG: hypothetical protein JSU81_06760 [Candidatus Coatesbacteria bacterium]|nr:MAG: hypothetical protein JSU81_06760 [Candidatus Coatesbacteria bacterium]
MMGKFIGIFAITATLLGAFAARAEDVEATAPEAQDQAEAGYVVREEKVINYETGKVEQEKVIEFPELEIFPELSRPVEIIIPRTEPDFEHMPFTIYNNEPSPYLPEDYRLEYYGRVPVSEETLRRLKSGDMFRPADEEAAEEEGQTENNP